MAPGRLSITQVSPQIRGQLAIQQQRNTSPPPSRSNVYECYMCTQFTSTSVEGIGAHVKKEHLNLKEGLGCVFEGCGFRGSIMAEMRQHYSSFHESKESREAERTTCLLCGARRRTEGEVMRHIRIVHLKDNEYLCNACGRFATFSLKEWANHVHQNHADNPPKIEFRRSEGFDPSKRLPMTAQPAPEEVVDLTDGPDEGKNVSYTYICSFCKYTTKEISDMSVHVKKHGQNTKFVIKYQNNATKAEGTTTMSTLTTSTTTTTMAGGRSNQQKQLALMGPDEKPGVQFKCFHCPEKFSSKDILLKHFEKEHDQKATPTSADSGDKAQCYNFLCMLCDNKTQSDEDIKKHVISTHFKTFQSICPHCPHVALSPADLTAHGQQEHYKHFSLSKLLCAKCDYTSKNVEVMQTHASKAHGAESKKKDGSGDMKDEDNEPKKEDSKPLKRKREESSDASNTEKADPVAEAMSKAGILDATEPTESEEKPKPDIETTTNLKVDAKIAEAVGTKSEEKTEVKDEVAHEKSKEGAEDQNETKKTEEKLELKDESEEKNKNAILTKEEKEQNQETQETSSNEENLAKESEKIVTNEQKADEKVGENAKVEKMETDVQDATVETTKLHVKGTTEEKKTEASESTSENNETTVKEKEANTPLSEISEQSKKADEAVSESNNPSKSDDSKNKVENAKTESGNSNDIESKVGDVKADQQKIDQVVDKTVTPSNDKEAKTEDKCDEEKGSKMTTKENDEDSNKAPNTPSESGSKKEGKENEEDANKTLSTPQRSTRSSRSQPIMVTSTKNEGNKTAENPKETEKIKDSNANEIKQNSSPYPSRTTRSQTTPPAKPQTPTPPSKKIRLSELVDGKKAGVSKSGNNFDAPLPLS